MKGNRIHKKRRKVLLLLLASAIVYWAAGNVSLSAFAWNGNPQIQKPSEPVSTPSAIGLTAESGGEDRCVRLAWKPVTGAAFYEVHRAPAGGDSSFQRIGETNVTHYRDETVVRGRLYDYCVVAQMEDGTYYEGEIVSGICPLRKVTGVRLRRYSSTSAYVTWKKNRNAACYRIFAAKGNSGDFRCIGITRKTRYRMKHLKKNRKYLFRVQACAARRPSEGDGAPSQAVAMKMKLYQRTTVFAGDSITTGLNAYRTIDRMRLGSKKKVVAAIGLNTSTFRTRRCFGGQSGLERVISYKPYRVYMMLGMNEIPYRSSKDVAAGYRDLIRTIQAESPDTEIVLLAVSPVTKEECGRREGFGQIPELNRRLKKLAKEKHMKYYDYTGFLKDAEGYLSTKYAVADGVHWNAAGYEMFGKVMSEFDRLLDR